MTHPLVLAITGASGVIYGQRLLEVLLSSDLADTPPEIHLTISESGRLVLEHELQLSVDLERFELQQILPNVPDEGRVVYHHYRNFMTPIASGSFRTRGMVICPCSGSTLSGIANAASQNLIQRAAEVHLKERRPLILVPRETPLSLIQIDNLRKSCESGATILPASPGFYHGYQSVSDLVDFVVGRILDQLDIEHTLVKRWAGGTGDQ